MTQDRTSYPTASAVSVTLLAVLGLLLIWISSPVSVEAQEPLGENQLEDRVLAVVDEDPVLESDLERLTALGLVAPEPGEGQDAFRRRLLDALIEQRLRFHAIERFGFEEIPVQAVEGQVAEIKARFEDDAAFRDELARLGLDQQALRQLLTRQLMVLTYTEERLGPRIFVRDEDISAYYRNVLVPGLGPGTDVPPLETVREDIRRVLREQRLNEEIRTWTDELREEADIRIYADAPRDLPPVAQ